MSAADQLAAQAEAVIDETIVLARIPAPPLDEAQRAEFVRQRLANAGLRVSTDATGNVLAETDGIAPGPALTVAAHLDTVFSRDVRHESRRERDRLFGPGVGDNTVAVAALLALARQLAAEASPMPVPVHLLFSVGEEGAGNLAGVRAYVAERGAALGAFLALEGHYLGRVSIDAVGSRRWLVRVDGRGGHSWEDFDTPSAVHALSRAIAALTAVEVPPDTAFNVGSIEGGQGINVIATSAAARIDLRSTSEIALTDLEAHMQHCFRREAAGTDLRVHFESLGRGRRAALTRSRRWPAPAAPYSWSGASHPRVAPPARTPTPPWRRAFPPSRSASRAAASCTPSPNGSSLPPSRMGWPRSVPRWTPCQRCSPRAEHRWVRVIQPCAPGTCAARIFDRTRGSPRIDTA